MRERIIAAVLILSTSGCAKESPATSSETTTTSESSTTDTTTETTGSCGELPVCELCPDEMGSLCGLPCPQGAEPCTNTIGDGMSCDAGMWTCVVHPPLGTECNEVCTLTEACSEAGCTSGFTLALEAETDALPVGAYELALAIDGVEDGCSFTISDDPEACAIPPCVTDSDCNALYLLQASPQRVELAFGVLRDLTITVSRDAIELVQESFVPSYALFSPNGSGCEPVCPQASAELVIP